MFGLVLAVSALDGVGSISTNPLIYSLSLVQWCTVIVQMGCPKYDIQKDQIVVPFERVIQKVSQRLESIERPVDRAPKGTEDIVAGNCRQSVV